MIFDSKKHIYYIALHIRKLEIASFSFFHTCRKNNGTTYILKNKLKKLKRDFLNEKKVRRKKKLGW
jgi:hypothetical protein